MRSLIVVISLGLGSLSTTDAATAVTATIGDVGVRAADFSTLVAVVGAASLGLAAASSGVSVSLTIDIGLATNTLSTAVSAGISGALVDAAGRVTVDAVGAKVAGTDRGSIGGGQTPGARSRLLAACRSTSRTMRQCASAMKPSIKRCSFKVVARCAAS